MKALALLLLSAMAAVQCLAAERDRVPIEAVTVDGQKVQLFPNGRWVYVDAAKAAEAQQVAGQ